MRFKDYYYFKAKRENYPARSVYKLQEIDRKFSILKRGQKILELGASPGSWLLYSAKRIGKKGLILAADLNNLEIQKPRQVIFIRCDVTSPSEEFISELKKHSPFSLVLSDMAPKTTGIKVRDQALSLELAETAFYYANNYLKKGGSFIVKIFYSEDVVDFKKKMKKYFKEVKIFKPQSSRKESKEIFLIGLKFEKLD